MRILLVLVLTALLVVGHSSNAQADGGWTSEQLRIIALIYTYCDFYGIRPVDCETMLRIAYRESGYTNATGDHGGSVGPFQLYDKGVYLSTPYYQEYGLAGRYNVEVNVAATMWAVNHGMISHWQPNLHVRWLAEVPSDPREK